MGHDSVKLWPSVPRTALLLDTFHCQPRSALFWDQATGFVGLGSLVGPPPGWSTAYNPFPMWAGPDLPPHQRFFHVKKCSKKKLAPFENNVALGAVLMHGCFGLLFSINSSSASPTLVWSSSTIEFYRWSMCLACSPAPALVNWDFGGKCLMYPLNDALIYLMDKSVLFVRYSSTFNKIDLKSNHITPIVFKASLRR
jgi:hypothetical protein